MEAFLPIIIISGTSTVIILSILSLWHQDHKLQSLERKDLYDRLMAQNLTEFKAVSEPEENKLEDEEDPDVIDLDEAKGDLMSEDTE